MSYVIPVGELIGTLRVHGACLVEGPAPFRVLRIWACPGPFQLLFTQRPKCFARPIFSLCSAPNCPRSPDYIHRWIYVLASQKVGVHSWRGVYSFIRWPGWAMIINSRFFLWAPQCEDFHFWILHHIPGVNIAALVLEAMKIAPYHSNQPHFLGPEKYWRLGLF